MIARFAQWLKPGGILEFTSGDSEYEGTNSDMLNQEHHLVWIAKKNGV
jgi:hypothetical protein